MYISPNTHIKLYSGIPWDNTYTDTVYFESREAQYQFFHNPQGWCATNDALRHSIVINTFQRPTSGFCEVEVPVADCYYCNYLAFTNQNFPNTFGHAKYFYCFITNVEYVNNVTTRIYYEIDVMQTYMFNVTLEECLVEREHVARDVRGENILPEPVALGEYVYDDYRVLEADDNVNLYSKDVVVMYTDISGDGTHFTSVEGHSFGGVYNGCRMKAFGGDIATVIDIAVNNFLSTFIQHPDAIVNLFMCPHFLSQGTRDGKDLVGWTSDTIPIAKATIGYLPTMEKFTDKYTGQEWTPRNRKTLTYPYNYMHLDNGCDSTMQLRYEFFNTTTMTLALFGSPTPPVQITVAPDNYKGNTLTETILGKEYIKPLSVESLTMANFPTCSWNYDTYKAWMAQNTVPIILGGVKSMISAPETNPASNALPATPTQEVVGGAIDMAKNMASYLLDTASSVYTASIQADTARGNMYNGNALYANNLARFHIARAHLPVSQLKIIDDFFTMYGYAVNAVKVPNVNVRKEFTFTKTKGAKILAIRTELDSQDRRNYLGGCPADALQKMTAIYDSGITFWKNASHVGNYSLDNSPITNN